MTYRIVVLGPQGSGKGTQGELLVKQLGIPLISAGALWRKEIAQGTDLGRQVEELVRNGSFAPNELTAELVRARLAQEDAQNGFILDSYPRSKKQFDLFEVAPTHVVALTLSDREAVKRMSGRLVCPQCGSNYHVVYNPPKYTQGAAVWFCDNDEAVLVTRDDDKPEAVHKRLGIYHAETEPILSLYRARGILSEIDASQPIEKVHEDIMRALKQV